MKKKFLIICFFLILTTSLTTGILSNKMMKDNYINSIFLTGISNGNLINKFLKENKNAQFYLYKLSQTFSERTDFRVTFIREDGIPLADSDDNSIIFSSFKNDKEFNTALIGKSTYRIVKKTGERVKTIEIFTNKVELNDKKIIIMLSKKLNLFEEFKEKTALIIVFSITISGILSIILSLFFIDKMTKPIYLLTKATKKIGIGDFSMIPKIESHDEIEELTDSFNLMNIKINQLLQDIEKKMKNLQAIIDNLNEAIFVTNYDGDIVLINEFAFNEFKFKERVNNIFECEELRFLGEVLKKSFSEKKSLNIKVKNSKNIYQLKTKTIKIEEKQVIITLQNITKVVIAEELRKDFVANASHELKTPITIISGFVETIKMGNFTEKSQLDYFLSIIEGETVRLTNLVNKLLRLSNIENSVEEKKMFTISLKKVFENLIVLYHQIASSKNIKINSYIEDKNITSLISEEWIREVVGNLIDNSIKYSKENSEIMVDVRMNKSKLSISVADNGYGMNKEEVKKIFRRFYRVDKSRNNKIKGSGLGLAIVKNMVSSVKGKIKVKTELGKGSTFTIILDIEKQTHL